MWYRNTATAYKGYSGNDTCYAITVLIYNSQNDVKNSVSQIATVMFSDDFSNEVTFSNGSATKSWSDGYVSVSP
jgi:hypothetical protein